MEKNKTSKKTVKTKTTKPQPKYSMTITRARDNGDIQYINLSDQNGNFMIVLLLVFLGWLVSRLKGSSSAISAPRSNTSTTNDRINYHYTLK